MKRAYKFILFGVAAFLLLQIAGFVAVKYGWTNVAGQVDDNFSSSTAGTLTGAPLKPTQWSEDEEWQTFKLAMLKDKEVLKRAAADSGVSARLIMTVVAVEQLRLYYSEREVFKQVFAPLKMLGSQTQFSWGVAGIKQETAKAVEDHLKAPASPYYLGKEFEKKLDFTTLDQETERFERIVDEHNHYYSYLYAGLYLKQVIAQWEKGGEDISNRPEILATLYNIGFAKSHPKAEPQVGGASIEIGSTPYTFGGLAYDIYYSRELLDEFPR